MVWRAGFAMVLVVLSGCAASTAGDDRSGEGAEGATLRGVVVDQAIRPLTNASVVARGGGADLNTTTGDDGLFEFTGLQPGVYVLTVSKAFYSTQQVTAQVETGKEPATVNIELVLETGILPFANAVKWEGFLECSASIGNWCGIANLYPCIVMAQAGQPCFAVSNDRSFNFQKEFFTDLQRIPDWLQIEAYWESTQSFSESLGIRFAATNQSEWDQFSFGPVMANAHGPSPLVVAVPGDGVFADGNYRANETTLKESGLGIQRGLTTELFHGAPNAAPRELEDACVPDNPVGGACWTNRWAGVAASQRISIVYMAFYGYTPPEGWSLAASGEIPPPPS